jgi:hypothetical protein
LVLLLAGVFAGCNRGVQNEAAVRQGVIDYLSTKSDLNMSQMQVDVTSVTFRENEAVATIAFRPKGSATGGMEMRYTLERQGSRWVVKGRGESQPGAAPHGQQPPGAGSLPPGHPPAAAPPPKTEAPKTK